MSNHDELIERLRASAAAMPFDAAAAVQYREAADALEAQAREIERLREWGNMFRNAVTVEVKSAGTDEEGNCRIIAFSTPMELAKGPSLVFKRAKLVLQPNT